MSSVKYIVANYLKVLGVEDQTISQMVGFLEDDPHYPSLRSISDCFDEWQFRNIAATATIEKIKDLEGLFLAHLNIGEGAFVLVIKAEQDQIIYLSNSGEIILETYESFNLKWSKAIFVAEIDPQNPIQKKNNAFNLPIQKATLKEIKKVAFNQEEPYTYKFFRNFSIYFSYIFLRLKVGPNSISTLWMLCLIAASYLFSLGDNILIRLSCCSLICLHFMLDCSDGEVARITKKTSRVGSIFEQTIHWTTNLALIAGITLGLYKQSGNSEMILLGLFCLLTDSCFHFFYIQLNYWINDDIDYGWFHKITSAAYQFMPININLFFIGSLFDQLHLAMLIWCSISSFLFLALSLAFFQKEFSILRKSR